MSNYDVTTITVRPGTHPKALARLKDTLAPAFAGGELLACWYSEIGALNQILLIRACADGVRLNADREAIVTSANPLGIGEFIAGMTMDTYVPFPFMQPIKAGRHGPIYEVRTYILKPDGLAPTIELWRKWVPGRANVSPLLAALYCVTGATPRIMHVWPYSSLDERQRLRAKASADGVWPPTNGPDHFVSMQSDIYLASPISPMT